MAFLKKLQEQKDAKMKEMKAILDKAKTEERAMDEAEQNAFDKLEKEIADIKKTMEAEERAEAMNLHTKTTKESAKEELEERAFVDYVMKTVENRAGGQNLDFGSNGAIIPTSIVHKIIKEVKDRCPILARATVYHLKGKLMIPVYGATDAGDDITVSYSRDFEELTANAGKFKSIELDGFLIGALTLIGKQLETNSVFDTTAFIVAQMSEAIALFLEGELLKGTKDKMTGALSVKNAVTAASETAITADELITLQAKVKQVYQGNACWIMHPDTFLAVRLLKDANKRYLLQDDITGTFPHILLGKPIFLSDNMPKTAAGEKAVLYGDLSGLSVNIRENLEIQVLREKYATMHALGVVAWMEADSKVTDHQRMAVLQMAGTAATTTGDETA